MSKLGICDWCYTGRSAELLNVLQAHHIDMVQVEFGLDLVDPVIKIDDTMSALLKYKRHNLLIPAVSFGFMNETGIYEKSLFNKNLAACRALMELVRSLEIDEIIIPFFYRNEIKTKANKNDAIRFLQLCAEHAGKIDIKIVVENTLSPKHNDRVFDIVSYPSLFYLLDIYNLEYYQHNMQDLLQAKHIRLSNSIHVKNGNATLSGSRQIEERQLDMVKMIPGYNDYSLFLENEYSEYTDLDPGQDILLLKNFLACEISN